MWTILMAMPLVFLSTCSTGRQTNTSASNEDTILLYEKDTLLITNNVPSVLQCHFSTNPPAAYDNKLKTLLILENPTLQSVPDGAYELYITDQPVPSNNFSSAQHGFVTVLDLYSLTAPAAKRQLEVDISKHIKKIFLQKQSLQPVYISIRFGPSKLPDGSYSSKAGELRFTGIRMIQIKE